MSAEESPKPKEPKEIQIFREQYATALENARISAEHTATEGWGNIYTEQRSRVQTRRGQLSDLLRGHSESIKHRFLAEEEEKDLADIKKAIVELRESDESFRRDVIDPVTAPLRECDKIINSARTDAQNAERQAPLHTRGLADAMEAVIETMPRVKFILASGRLVVTNGPDA